MEVDAFLDIGSRSSRVRLAQGTVHNLAGELSLHLLLAVLDVFI